MNQNKMWNLNWIEFDMIYVENIENYINNIKDEKSKKINVNTLKNKVNNADRKMMQW